MMSYGETPQTLFSLIKINKKVKKITNLNTCVQIVSKNIKYIKKKIMLKCTLKCIQDAIKNK